ncbi:MAG: DoxX family protein [Nanoarchaeota archaeon]
MNKFFDKNSESFYAVFRIVVGLLFFTHGASKLFGWFGSKGTVTLMSLMGLAGVIEVVVGILLVLGLFTRYAALLGALNMIGAWVVMHVPKGGIWPWANGGELALMFFLAFLAILAKGPGIWAIDKEE